MMRIDGARTIKRPEMVRNDAPWGAAGTICEAITERAGFEPASGFKPATAFPVLLLRPLGHLSMGSAIAF